MQAIALQMGKVFWHTIKGLTGFGEFPRYKLKHASESSMYYKHTVLPFQLILVLFLQAIFSCCKSLFFKMICETGCETLSLLHQMTSVMVWFQIIQHVNLWLIYCNTAPCHWQNLTHRGMMVAWLAVVVIAFAVFVNILLLAILFCLLEGNCRVLHCWAGDRERNLSKIHQQWWPTHHTGEYLRSWPKVFFLCSLVYDFYQAEVPYL